MNEKEFCYWLQGAIELTKLTTFNEEQTELVKKHLEMVFVVVETPTYPIINELKGLFDISNPTELNKKQTQMIKEKLSNTFLKLIDPSYSSKLHKKLNEIHNGTTKKNSGVEILC